MLNNGTETVSLIGVTSLSVILDTKNVPKSTIETSPKQNISYNSSKEPFVLPPNNKAKADDHPF